MDRNIIRTLPFELQREVYGYLPLKTCIICEGIVLNYNRKTSYVVCSIGCLYRYNQRMLSDLALHRVAIPLFNVYIACNYMYVKCIIFIVLSCVFLGYNIVAVYCITFIANILGALWVFIV